MSCTSNPHSGPADLSSCLLFAESHQETLSNQAKASSEPFTVLQGGTSNSGLVLNSNQRYHWRGSVWETMPAELFRVIRPTGLALCCKLLGSGGWLCSEFHTSLHQPSESGRASFCRCRTAAKVR